MSRADIVKILKGIGMVIDIASKQNSNQLTEKMIRAHYHATELFKLFVETNNTHDSSSNSSSVSSSNSFKKTVNNEVNKAKKDINSTSMENPSIKPNITLEYQEILDMTKITLDNLKEDNKATTINTVINTTATSTVNTNTSSNVNFNTATIENNINEVKVDDISKDDSILNKPIIKKSDPLGFDSISTSVLESSDILLESPTNTQMKPKAVPATPIARVIGFGSLAAGLLFGKVKESTTSAIYGSSGEKSSMSDENANRLAESLSRMRGAALKLGQMLSLQDESILPPSLSKALNRVRQGADYMPEYQLESQLRNELGTNWRSLFAEFNIAPMAAASIGQVHRAVLRDTGTRVAVKVQYPGVARAIDSDLRNLRIALSVASLLPKGLFIDQIVKVAGEELAAECDYLAEELNQSRYRELVLSDPVLCTHMYVPRTFPTLCTPQVLVTEFVEGYPIDHAATLPQEVRDAVARTILVATVRELFEWRFVQSDPNFSNFLYDPRVCIIHCVDFGAARDYPKPFVDDYIELVWAAANNDSKKLMEVSKTLGFLSGDESAEMNDAHMQAGLLLGEPFRSHEPYDFAKGRITKRVSAYGEVFMAQRLKAPPPESYSLHRKLAGAFLLCIKLKAVIPCRDILEDVYVRYHANK